MPKDQSSKEKIIDLYEKDPLLYKEEVISKIGCTRSYLNRVLKSEGLVMLNQDEAPPELKQKRLGSILNPSICFGVNKSKKWCTKADPVANRCTVYATIPNLFLTSIECPFNQKERLLSSDYKRVGQQKTKSKGTL